MARHRGRVMHRTNNQAGLTAISLICLVMLVGLAVYIVLKAVPVYIEAFSVGDVVNSLKREADLPSKSREEIYTMIKKRLDVNDVRSVEQGDIDIQKTVHDVTVKIDYEVKVPLFWNIALAFSFHKSAMVR
jgi:hypothetical protein